MKPIGPAVYFLSLILLVSVLPCPPAAGEPTATAHVPVEELRLANGMTVLLVTHEADVARFARRVLRFLDGRVIADEGNAVPEDAGRLLAHESAAAA